MFDEFAARRPDATFQVVRLIHDRIEGVHDHVHFLVTDDEVDMIVDAYDTIMDETHNLKGRVWATSGELIKQAMSG